MVSKAKLYIQLDRLEDELRDRLVPHLENAINGRNDLIFCTTDFNLCPELKPKTDNETDALIQLGRQVLALREKLGESSQDCIAEKICWYCRQWGDGYDSHRKSVQGLAQAFLQEIVNTNTKI